jgi:hypothetical protein
MKTTKLLIYAVAISTALTASMAHGQNLTATLNGISPGLTAKGTFNNGSFTWDFPAGQMNFSSPGIPDFGAFCVEPLEDLGYGQTLVYQLQNTSTLANAGTIARLVGGYLASSRSDIDAAAVQWAIWETTNEVLASQSLSTGDIRIIGTTNSSLINLANQYLANVNTYTPATLTYLTNSTYQNAVTWNSVPEPTSALLGGLSCLLLLRRRRA